jgi:hypothetical protein
VLKERATYQALLQNRQTALMTVLQALAILEAGVLECEEANIDSVGLTDCIFCSYSPFRMMRRVLAVLLVLSWIALSGANALEDLDVDSHMTRAAGAVIGRPDPAEIEEQANNILELANSNAARLGDLVSLKDPAHHTFRDTYPATMALRNQKEHCVLII